MTNLSVFQFRLAMLAIFLLSLILRFWQLGQFNILVFDEFYYAKYANYYLIGKTFFNSHPPLSQYIIAIGIWLGSHLPSSPEMTNDLTGSLRSTFSYRWLNALTGSFLPLLVGAIAYQLTNRRSYTLIVTFLAAMDGLFLVESRYALNNIYLVGFGLLGQLFFLLFLNQKKYIYLTLSGIFFGATASVKWNGLGFLGGIYLIILMVWLCSLLQRRIENFKNNQFLNRLFLINWGLFNQINSVKLPLLFLNLLIIPAVTYSLLWFPHLLMNPQYNWWEVQHKIWVFHHQIGNSPQVHKYCSNWYTWLFMGRTIAYLYRPQETDSGKIIYDVHAMGNPVLWWFSTAAIFTIITLLSISFIKQKNVVSLNPAIAVYILVNYTVNLLPWIKVSRCTFLYHYMASYVFSWLALAWIMDSSLMSKNSLNRRVAMGLIILIIIAFIYWLPIYLGLPLSQKEFNMRMLLPSWI
ncbi:phospholipid carrier-dependent glycosyltransferase [Aphanothece sacrum]|uniref:Polyprenol-phosphate-mannose--protein mannosyltransferase n=1 Tax=Aphanothece sacrum FPU1 TaxID=1920663 RepID=A0A401IH05_APHSA|nr:phospholipid carrier-dependent glycosyltransferase [Aphanothece sacrum]GBF80548.1 dolichyl-phosphate-mannose--protein O-mannosyl transferase [Aphanothece sacrum FPU1]GBF84648.1 dolichyl-phosphate-mannose--protein O-mannosyl transferase [Aphanothece sacrum FPU3]